MKKNYILLLSLFFIFSLLSAQETIIKSPETDNFGEDNFGQYVSVNGNNMLVSAFRAQTLNGKTGTVYYYKKEGENWVLKQEIIPNDVQDDDSFGSRIELYGNTAIISAMNLSSKGAVYIYEFDGTLWNLAKKVINSDSYERDNFGYSISLKDENNFIASTYYNGDDTNRGIFSYVFEKINTEWVEVQKLTLPISPNRGLEVEYAGDEIFISDRSSSLSADSGVFVFKKQNNQWVEVQKLTAPQNITAYRFGQKIESDGTRVVVTSLPGNLFIFKKDGNNSWALSANIQQAGESSGSSLSLNNNLLLLGSLNNEVFVYQNNNDLWELKNKIIPTNNDELAFGTSSLQINHDNIYIGSYHNDSNDISGVDNGGVFIYNTNNVLSNKKDELNNFNIYPNPINEIVKISSLSKIVKKEIYDYSGRLILSTYNDKKEINISNLSSGIYILKITDNYGNHSSKKLIKK